MGNNCKIGYSLYANIYGSELLIRWLNGHVRITDTDCIVRLNQCVLTNEHLTMNLIGLDNLYLSWRLGDSNFWILRKHLRTFKDTISQVDNSLDSWTLNLLAQSFWCSKFFLYCC